MERSGGEDAISPSWLHKFHDNFRKAGISPAGLEFEDFVQFVDRPLKDILCKSATRFNWFESEDTNDDALLVAASQAFEEQVLLAGDPVAGRGNYDDIRK